MKVKIKTLSGWSIGHSAYCGDSGEYYNKTLSVPGNTHKTALGAVIAKYGPNEKEMSINSVEELYGLIKTFGPCVVSEDKDGLQVLIYDGYVK